MIPRVDARIEPHAGLICGRVFRYGVKHRANPKRRPIRTGNLTMYKTRPTIAAGIGFLLCLAGCTSEEPAAGMAGQASDDGAEMPAAEAVAAADDDSTAGGSADDDSAASETPQFEVDPAWPLQLPNRWTLGQVSGIATDSQDNVWIIQRPRSLTEHEMGAAHNPPWHDCCLPAPSVIAFGPAGEVIHAWGGPTWDQESGEWVEPEDWPANEHGIFVDYQDNVWIAGNGMSDHVVLKFTPDGERLLRIGEWQTTMGSNDPGTLGRPADITVDPETHEVYIADGYLNRRVIVFDADTGEYKRHWGAFGNVPDDTVDTSEYLPDAEPLQVWHNPVHAVRIANDGLVYIADRMGNRIHVFNKDGSFVQEGRFADWTIGGQGAAWDIELSGDPEQQWLFAADGANKKVWILERDSLEVVSSFGHGGRQAGQFEWVHNVAADSFGNLFTAEVNTGKRVQKWVPVGAL